MALHIHREGKKKQVVAYRESFGYSYFSITRE